MLTANLPWTNSASSSLWSAKKSNWSHSVDSKGNGAASLTTSLAMLNCCEVSSYSKEVCWYYCVREQCCARHMESSVLRKLSRLSSNSSPNKQECTNTGLKSKLMIKGSKRSDPWSTKKKGQGFDHKGSLGTSPRNPHDGVYVTVSLLFCFNQNNMEVKPILRKISQNANNKFWWCSRFWRDFDLLGYVSLLHIQYLYTILCHNMWRYNQLGGGLGSVCAFFLVLPPPYLYCIAGVDELGLTCWRIHNWELLHR